MSLTLRHSIFGMYQGILALTDSQWVLVFSYSKSSLKFRLCHILPEECRLYSLPMPQGEVWQRPTRRLSQSADSRHCFHAGLSRDWNPCARLCRWPFGAQGMQGRNSKVADRSYSSNISQNGLGRPPDPARWYASGSRIADAPFRSTRCRIHCKRQRTQWAIRPLITICSLNVYRRQPKGSATYMKSFSSQLDHSFWAFSATEPSLAKKKRSDEGRTSPFFTVACP